MLFMVCRWPQLQEGDWVRPHLCKLARHGPWPVRRLCMTAKIKVEVDTFTGLRDTYYVHICNTCVCVILLVYERSNGCWRWLATHPTQSGRALLNGQADSRICSLRSSDCKWKVPDCSMSVLRYGHSYSPKITDFVVGFGPRLSLRTKFHPWSWLWLEGHSLILTTVEAILHTVS